MSDSPPQTYSQEELRRIILNPAEDSHIDSKGPMTWDNGVESARLAKDIAAFANSRDGGFVVLGKEEADSGKFKLTGLTEEQAKSFDTTKVANWVNSRFSPRIRVVCYRAEHEGNTFVVMRIFEFDDIPVICTKQFGDPHNPKKPLLQKGSIYVRTSGAESKPLQEEGELCELVGLATKKQAHVLLQHFDAMLRGRAVGEQVTDQQRSEKALDRIRNDLSDRGSLDPATGWTFFFHPASYREERWTDLATLEDLVRRTSVRISDTFPPSRKGTFRTEWGIANDTYGETWALSRSGIFFFCAEFREDSEFDLKAIREHVGRYARQTNEWRRAQFLAELDQFRWIEFQWNMRILIQNFAFMARFAELFDPGETVCYGFAASALRNRHLISLDSRLSLHFEPQYRDTCGSNRFSQKKSVSVEELLANWRDECALVMYRFFELFPDYNIPRETLRGWVDQYTGQG